VPEIVFVEAPSPEIVFVEAPSSKLMSEVPGVPWVPTGFSHSSIMPLATTVTQQSRAAGCTATKYRNDRDSWRPLATANRLLPR